MVNDIFFEIHDGLPRQGPGRSEYTRRAFEMLPVLDRPEIIDIGCGPGGPTIELARLSNGNVTGIDTHQPFLDELMRRAKKLEITDRVKALNCSMFEMDFPEESFDIIWAEGSIYIMGFEKGLRDWRRLIKPNGFLVVHEMCWLQPDPPKKIADYWEKVYPGILPIAGNLEIIPGCGYSVLGHFPLPEDAWWEEYYDPLEERLPSLRKKYVNDPDAIALLDEEQEEIDMFRKYHAWYGSVFFVMQKSE